jgi:hypothetical protein
VPLKVVPKPARGSENCSEAGYECTVHQKKLTNESEGKPEQKFDSALYVQV